MSVVRLLIKRLPNGEGLPMPRAMTDGAAGLDLHAAGHPVRAAKKHDGKDKQEQSELGRALHELA